MDNAEWNRASDPSRVELSKRLLNQLPEGFAFIRLAEFKLGDATSCVGVFEFRGRTFVFVPGGEFRIGFDPGRWTPSDDERVSYARSASTYSLPPIREHMSRVLRSPRTRVLPALIVECEASVPEWTEITEEPAREFLGEQMPASMPTFFQLAVNDTYVRIQAEPGGQARFHRFDIGTRDEFAESIAPFRPLAGDEWERLCGGGAPTLYRWGDHARCDVYPTDQGEFDLHQRANAFGVVIGGNPYKPELVAAPDFARGGDGGVAICGGIGCFLGWLPLASAYYDAELLSGFGLARVGPNTRVRRAIEVET